MQTPLHFADTPHRQNVPKRHALCGIVAHTLLLVLFAPGIVKGAATSPLIAQIPNMTVPAGGTAQIRVVLASPQSLTSSEIVMDLDPTVFGDIVAADVFSATGDQLGAVSIQGRHLDAQFFSALVLHFLEELRIVQTPEYFPRHAGIVVADLARLRDPTTECGSRFSELTVAAIQYVERHIQEGLPLTLPPALAPWSIRARRLRSLR